MAFLPLTLLKKSHAMEAAWLFGAGEADMVNDDAAKNKMILLIFMVLLYKQKGFSCFQALEWKHENPKYKLSLHKLAIAAAGRFLASVLGALEVLVLGICAFVEHHIAVAFKRQDM